MCFHNLKLYMFDISPCLSIIFLNFIITRGVNILKKNQ